MLSHRWEVIESIIKEKNFSVIAEIGILEGVTTRFVSALDEVKTYFMVEVSPSRQMNEFAMTTPKCVFLRMESVKAASFIKDKSIDLVFIDADHKYDSVVADINAWLPKVKDGGVLCGHDYGNDLWPDVKTVVDEIFKDKIKTYKNSTNVWRYDVPQS